MSKTKIRVLINKYVGADYVEFLKTGYDVEIVNYEDLRKIHPRDVGRIDIALFAGGADVNPDLYSERLGKHTSIDKNRDSYEHDYFFTARRFGALMLGICRGAQFVTVMSGGRLIQHVEGHGSPHDVVIPMLGTTLTATSTHHQMMYPFDLKDKQFELVGWSKFFNSPTYLNGRNEEIDIDSNFLEPEIVYYHNTHSLAIQGHPEFASANDEYKSACISLIRYYLERKNNRNEDYN